MANLTSADIGKIVSFTLYPAAVIGTEFSYVKVKAILDPESTYQWIDPVSRHANVYPTLPPGVPNSWRGYNYVKVELADGQVTCVGLPWIDESSITIHTNTTVQAVISDVQPTDITRIRDLLVLNGFNKLDIQFLD